MPEPSVRGIRQRFAPSAIGFHTLRVVGPRLPRLAGGWMPWLGLDRYLPPALPGPDWVRLRPILSGVCGSDIALLTGKASAILSPFASFPAVLGHEVVATITETGPGVQGWSSGERVALDPVLSCVPRGLEPCDWCRRGHTGLCLRTAEGLIAPAPMLGFCRDLPGGWSEAMVAHASQLHRVPEVLSDEAAVMVEPFSVALHGVLARPPGPGERVLVIGAGTMGLCVAAALRLAAPGAAVTVVARHAVQRRLAERFGATVARSPLEAAVERAGARRHRPLVGQDVLVGGFDQVYDAVGTARTLDAALRVAAPRGRVVIVGGPAQVSTLDWTLAWTRELRIQGTYVYGVEESLPGRPHTMDAAMDMLAAHPELPLGELVTHRFRLEEWRRAMAAALSRGRSGALKIVFAPGG
ncbi:MAG TPA: alcohol dehydrogenase catalytic domain-containing protein [Candidatus Limnocylindria bacterium]